MGSLLTGVPGFVRATTPGTVAIAVHPVPGDSLVPTLTRPVKVGMIAIEPATRRRMRLNGRRAEECRAWQSAAPRWRDYRS